MKKSKLLWLLFRVFLILGVSNGNSSNNNRNDDEPEIDTGSGGANILPEVLPTTPTSEGEASSVDDSEAGTVITGEGIGSTGQTDVDGSFRYESLGCLELQPNEERAIAGVGHEEALTPSVCMAGCHGANRVGAFMIRGDVCVCVYDEVEMDFFLLGRKPGVCRSPCSGDSTAMCGGRTAYSLLRLLDVEDGQDDLSHPSVDEARPLAGSGTTSDGSTGPQTAGSIGAGGGSGGPISHASDGDGDGDGDRDIAAAPDFGDDPQAGTVEAVHSPDDAETEADADMTINDPGSAEGTNAVRSSLYEYKGCVRLDSAERREAAILPPLAKMTPTACIEGCRSQKAHLAALMRGDVCMCAPEEDPYLFVPEREMGVCSSPCDGDATRTCGGEDSLAVFKLLYEGDSKDTLLQPSVGEVAQQAGSGTTADIPNGPTVDRSMDDGAGRIGSASPSLEAATGATEKAVAAPDLSDDPRQGAVEENGIRDYADTAAAAAAAAAAADAPEAVVTTPQHHISTPALPPTPSPIAAGDGDEKIFQPRTGTVHLKGGLFGWWKRELSIVHEDNLRLCKAKRAWTTGSCEEVPLDELSEIVAVLNPRFKKRKGVRHPFRVTTSASGAKSSHVWTLDAGSEDEMKAWVSLLKGVVARARAGNEGPTVDDSTPAKGVPAGNNPWDVYPPQSSLTSRGSSLSPSDLPLEVGQFLSALDGMDSVNLSISENGDVLLGRGDKPTPTSSDDPIWAHRSTGSSGGDPNGGLGCALESFWETLGSSSREDVAVHLRVKNGRWRVGRGALCTLGQSPKPAGSWRRYLPWDARGQAIKAASLELRDGTVVVASGEDILWSSLPSPQPGGGVGGEGRVEV